MAAFTMRAVRPAVQGARVVLTAATCTALEMPAGRMAVSLPGLKPYQPNQRMSTPKMKSE